MLEFYFLSNDGQVDLVKSFSRETAYQILFEMSDFEDFGDFTESINYVEWIDKDGVRNYYSRLDVAKTGIIEQDNKPLFLKNYLKLQEVHPEEYDESEI